MKNPKVDEFVFCFGAALDSPIEPLSSYLIFHRTKGVVTEVCADRVRVCVKLDPPEYYNFNRRQLSRVKKKPREEFWILSNHTCAFSPIYKSYKGAINASKHMLLEDPGIPIRLVRAKVQS